MVKTRKSASEAYPAIPDSVPVARRAVAAFAREVARLTGDQLDDVRTAVSEAVTNVVVHAYPAGQPGHVRVTVALASDELWVLVADEGRGHNAPSLRPGLGLGLAVIAGACDEFVIAERAGGGTEARMCFRVPELARSGA